MQYSYIHITLSPFSETACDIITAMLSSIGYDSFEYGDDHIKAYIPADLFDADMLRATLESVCLPSTTISHSFHQLEDKNWNETWERESFDPILEREYGIRLLPRMAFGSGAHDTTHQITAMLIDQDFSCQRVLDMGTGTGVLGIAMAKKGAKEVVAIDIDPYSVANAKDNFQLNDINCSTVIQGDASAISGTFDTIVANIHKNILIHDLPTYVSHLANTGTLILSGFFTSDIPDMMEAASLCSLSLQSSRSQNDWAVLTFKKA